MTGKVIFTRCRSCGSEYRRPLAVWTVHHAPPSATHKPERRVGLGAAIVLLGDHGH